MNLWPNWKLRAFYIPNSAIKYFSIFTVAVTNARQIKIGATESIVRVHGQIWNVK